MTFLVAGDANADLTAALARFPTEGDDARIAALGWGSGGSAANVAVALALLGARARLLARVGRDPAAEVALRAARAAGVDLEFVQYDDVLPSGLCFAAISPGGERTFFSFRGANANLTLAGGPAPLDSADWLHVAGHALLEGAQRSAALALIDAAAERDVPVSLDLCLPLARAHPSDLLALLPRLRILFANQAELAALAPALSPHDAARWLIERGARSAAIKLGSQGCVVADENGCHTLPAFAVEPLDTNGCGDAFVAGFLHAYQGGAPIQACALLANALGALTATRHGSAEALPDRARLRAFVAAWTPNNLTEVI